MRQRRKWISALILAVLLGVAWWLRPRPVPPAPVPALTAAPVLKTPLVSRWPASIPAATPKSPAKSDQVDEIEICGIGKVKVDRDDWADTDKYLNSLIRKLGLRWLSTLRNSDDYRARATGLYLGGIFDRESQQEDSELAHDELVQLALATRDPAIYAIAYTKCPKGNDDIASHGACAQLSLDDWTRVDADNAVPWLELAAKARREKDAAAEAAAFARAAQAHRYETYKWSLFSFAQAAIPADATAADRWLLTMQVIGVEAAMPISPFQPVSQYCSRASDAAVRGQCNSLAELMVNRSTTLLEFGLGKTLGARIGWPAERVDKLSQELKASLQVMNQINTSDPRQQWSCDSVARGNAFVSRWAELGERALAKQAIESSGETIAELASRYDERMEAMMRDAQARAPAIQPQPAD